MNTVGNILKTERIAQKITLEQIEKSTKIRKKYLQYLEDEDWDKFSSKTYILGIITQYSKYLKLNEEKMTAFFRREYEKVDEVAYREKIGEKYLTPQARGFFKLSIVVIMIFFFSYLGYQIKVFMTPPRLELLTPKETTFHDMERVNILGKTDKETIINVNGERIFLNENNNFETYIPLFKEKNPVYIEAIGANGKKSTISKIFIRN